MPNTNMTGDDLYTKLSAGLDEAVEKGHLPNPGAKFSEVSQRNATDSDSYLKALRTRLVDLGYLEDTEEIRESHEVDASFISAIKLFQKESAILSADGWAGPKTWAVLQQLVSFEDEHEPRNWKLPTSLNTNTAVARAAWLRLWVMGFFYEPPTGRRKNWFSEQQKQWQKDKLNQVFQSGASVSASEIVSNKAFQRAYDRFCDFAQRLGLSQGKLSVTPQLDEPFLNALFNYDEIIRLLGGNGKEKKVVASLEKFDKQFEKEFKVQIDALARIELWLLGYDCAPGLPRNVYTTAIVAGYRKRQKEVLDLTLAIGQFWEIVSKKTEHTEPIEKPESAPETEVSPALFKGFYRLLTEEAKASPKGETQESTTEEEEKKKHNELIDQVNAILAEENKVNKKVNEKLESLRTDLATTTETKKRIKIEKKIKEIKEDNPTFLDRFKTLGSSIWDGVKRVAKFIWRLIKGAVEKVVSFVKNLARFIAKEAREFFYVVVRAVDAVHGGIVYLSNSFYPKEPGSPFYISRSADMDHTVLFDSAASNITASRHFKSYQRLSECYCAGCVVLGELAMLFRKVIGLVKGVVGWLQILLSLGRFRASYLRIKEALDFLKDKKDCYVKGTEDGALMFTDVA